MKKGAKIAGVLLLSLGLVKGYDMGRDHAEAYVDNNQLFIEEKVEDGLNYYGGDTRYVDQRYNMFLFDDPIYKHFNPEKINNEIVVGFKDNISDQYMEEIEDVLDYYNGLFEVINPEYHFVAKRATDLNSCNILVEAKPLERIDESSVIGAMVKQNFDFVNNAQMKSATVYINENFDFDGLTLRFAFAHEMMHILYATGDVNGYESPTTSIYNTPDVNMILSDFKNPYAVIHKDHLDMDSFVNLFPVDVATLVALYGDSSTQENVDKYLDLIRDNWKYCESIYGRQYYFEDGFVLPESSGTSNETTEPEKNAESEEQNGYSM